MASKIMCPQCGKEIELKPQDGNPNRLIAYCYCGGSTLRAVFLTDADKYLYPDTPAKSDKKKEL